MKKTLFAALALVAMLFSACSSAPELTVADFETLLDNVINGEDEVFTGALSEEYYSLWREACDVPSDVIDGIGSDEWLWYVFNPAQDIPDEIRFDDISVNQSGKTAHCSFLYVELYDGEEYPFDEPFQVDLEYRDGKWLVTDWNNTRDQLLQYIREQRKLLRTEEWRQSLQNDVNEGYADQQDLDDLFMQVDEYFRVYPNER